MPSSQQPLPPKTQYDAILVDSAGKLLSINQLAGELKDDTIVVIGEYHCHHASHLLQSLLQTALYQQNQQQVLSMEQFEIDHQAELNRYLNGETGETEMRKDAGAWSNYTASYRPLIEFARARSLPVIAANAPADVVRCVGRQGIDYLESVSDEQRAELPEPPLTEPPAYREKFFAALGHGHGQASEDSDISQRMKNSYQAQLLRDNTMAQRIIEASRAYPEHQILHTTGTFHAENRLGTVAVLEQKRPDLSVALVSPVLWDTDKSFATVFENNRDKGDYLYLIQPLPTEFKDQERQRESMMARFEAAGKKTCQ
ncbi:ChaN family lipoprotein [Marinobacter sp. CHS3-4]|uniref:ChaN family lipoprotein n=1 Tax=Marinobacter sp. CHS3-4 TaxID=3045174 RepID=UPI0024B4DA1B|nr:ChaN family lipoprotein [Marinobacter sp. CHS3-4]MDI9244278.1 ChaN family lipoprotein [Marinobacter sp. CHS3-4]